MKIPISIGLSIFFANLFSNESDYIRAQMDLQTRMAQEKQKMYEDRAKAEMLAMEQKANKIKDSILSEARELKTAVDLS